ncbi:MAG: nitrite reductase, copper-containing [Rhodospirillaceae bacterium]|jgi:nitrite reductase (NO-forming)|nr:nitrite reductase, copper-containing [Rhodospirillales bacterium]MBT3907533.1 nitrite reductase, copper-containing [Rhodospirillaceae bacterium]MBT4700978.1 nitrite reductase, copper-containing [Rhodospirillaceae bacterium]MBT5036829.1 nitrite reductase, copper-containing [Rhodospirillaceae bacterium]MBT6219133.1 nitrite reductase, copper-containing [Rhodospirillaceae bacterium]
MYKATKNNQGVSRRTFLSSTAAAGVGTLAVELTSRSAEAATQIAAADISKLPRVKQELVAPPFAPKHDQVAKGGPKVVEITMVIKEKKMVLDDDGTEIWALTYDGWVPGPLVIVHEGDYVELTLINPESNAMEHNIDFHASTGALGGGGLTHVTPGEETVLRFKATKPGVFVYHCAPGGVMIPYHVTHGMNGAIMVLPRDGLKDKAGKPIRYDRIYYIGEQDYYVAKDSEGEYKKYETAGEDYADYLETMATLTPSHIVFNGAIGALTGPNALKANVGETVMIIHSQANRDTRPHLIGGHGDHVWSGGSFTDDPQTGLETWFIAGGAAGAATYTFLQPGIYAYVNHNLIEAVLKGAAAHFSVKGTWDNDLMKQVKKPSPIKK